MIKLICTICGNLYSIKNYRQGTSLYCSRECCNVGSSKRIRVDEILEIEKLTLTDIVYLAGIFDGEGCIYIKEVADTRKLVVAVSITNTSLDLYSWLQSKLSIGRPNWHRPEGHKLRFDFRIRSVSGCYQFLKLVCPYLIIKRTKAENTIKKLEGRYKL